MSNQVAGDIPIDIADIFVVLRGRTRGQFSPSEVSSGFFRYRIHVVVSESFA